LEIVLQRQLSLAIPTSATSSTVWLLVALDHRDQNPTAGRRPGPGLLCCI